MQAASLLPLAIAFAVTLLATPACRRLAGRVGLLDRPDEGLKPHGRPVPYMGGVAIYLGWLAAVAWTTMRAPAGAWGSLPWIAAGGTLLMLTGLVDDFRHLRPRTRLAVQAAVALLLISGGIGRRLAWPVVEVARPVLPEWLSGEAAQAVLSGLLLALLLAGATNSTNLIDGLDGLCGGIVAIAALGLAALAWMSGDASPVPDGGLTTSVALALGMVGACLAFLCYNFNPASIFMGDSGSLLLGYGVAVLLALLGEGSGWRWLAAGLVAFGFPILDTGLAIGRRWRNGRPLFVGDRSHFYDQLRDRGLSVRGTVLVCYGLGCVFALTAICIVRFPAILFIAILAAMPLVAAGACWSAGMLKVDDAAERSRGD
jgi:UDP-GlcNAc:undecaprenyl-phosphate GlcNAc-1-phosphate transferase